MRSSTFSFNRIPDTKSGLLIVALITSAVGLLGAELLWRSGGAKPQFSDNTERWSMQRDQVGSLNAQSDTVIVGSSRILLGFSLDTFKKRFPDNDVVQLAISGTYPFLTLEDIATNTNFAGVVLVDMSAQAMSPERREDGAGHLYFYKNSWNLNNKVNFVVDDFLQKILITRNPRFGLRPLISTYAKPGGRDTATDTSRVLLSQDRDTSSYIDARAEDRIRNKVLSRRKKESESAAPMNQNEWEAGVESLNRLATEIQSRGGKIVFLRMPTDGEHWLIDEAEYPIEKYWRYMSDNVAGEWIHFRETPSLNDFELPDSSHIDASDKKQFTDSLIDILVGRGIYE